MDSQENNRDSIISSLREDLSEHLKGLIGDPQNILKELGLQSEMINPNSVSSNGNITYNVFLQTNTSLGGKRPLIISQMVDAKITNGLIETTNSYRVDFTKGIKLVCGDGVVRETPGLYFGLFEDNAYFHTYGDGIYFSSENFGNLDIEEANIRRLKNIKKTKKLNYIDFIAHLGIGDKNDTDDKFSPKQYEEALLLIENISTILKCSSFKLGKREKKFSDVTTTFHDE